MLETPAALRAAPPSRGGMSQASDYRISVLQLERVLLQFFDVLADADEFSRNLDVLRTM